MQKIRKFYLDKKLLIFSIVAAAFPFIFYILTLEKKLIGGDTSWYMIELPQMDLLPPTGYPIFSLIGKLFSLIPLGPLALRLNLISAVFGSLTILFLFLAINKLVKNFYISLVASFSFAFAYPYWSYANRLEFDTLNSFFIALLLFAIFKYREEASRRNLYFCFFSLGFLLTNHPIAFFIMPAFLIMVIVLNPKIFKSIKIVFLSIVFFIFPLFSYLFTYFIFRKNYKSEGSLIKFLYYITGRQESGATFGGSFGDKSFMGILGVVYDYIKLIYENYGIVLIIIAIIGMIYLFIKNWKIALFSVLAIVFNLIITTQYLDWAVLNYTLNIMLIMSVYIGFGILLFIETLNHIFEKAVRKSKKTFTKKYFKNAAAAFLILLFASQPVLLIINNYKKCDFSSSPAGIYTFWSDAFSLMNKDAKLYAYTSSYNIGIFISKFEQEIKNIQVIKENDSEYCLDKIIEDVTNGIHVYFIGNETAINQAFATEKVGEPFYWERFNENLQLYEITKDSPKIKIEGDFENHNFQFGKEIIVKYIITNKSSDGLKINSIELELPEGLKFDGMVDDSDIKDGPGISKGKFMWVSDNYNIEVDEKLNFVFKIIPERTGDFNIKLRLTTGGVFFTARELSFNVN